MARKISMLEIILQAEVERKRNNDRHREAFLQRCVYSSVSDQATEQDADIALREIKHKWGRKDIHAFLVDLIAEVQQRRECDAD